MANNKRAHSPEIQSIDWPDTKLDELKREDLNYLFKSRQMDMKGITTKEAMIEKLKKEGDIIIENPENLTNRELTAELRLRGLNDDAAKKETLLARYRGEDDEPPRKKQRVGKKPRGKKASCYVALYSAAPKDEKAPETDNENDEEKDDTFILGVYKAEKNAYEEGVEKLLDDIKNKSDKDYKKVKNDLDKLEKNDYEGKLSLVSERCENLFGAYKDPYVKITRHEIN